MFNKKLSLLVLAGVVGVSGFTSNADAKLLGGNLYVSGGYGRSTGDKTRLGNQTIDGKTQNMSAAFGWEIPVPIVGLRGELEYNSNVGAYGGTLRYQTTMANFYLAVPLMLPIVTPYVGFGFGSMMNGRIENDKLKSSSANQYILGLEAAIPLMPLKVSLEYRRVNPSLKTYDNVYANTIQDQVIAKVRYTF